MKLPKTIDMWAVLGRGYGLHALANSKWKAEEIRDTSFTLEGEDVKKVSVEIKSCESVEGLRAMKVGDIVFDNGGGERKVLAIVDEVFAYSYVAHLERLLGWYTFTEAEQHRWKLKGQEETHTIVIDGKETEMSEESFNNLKKSLD